MPFKTKEELAQERYSMSYKDLCDMRKKIIDDLFYEQVITNGKIALNVYLTGVKMPNKNYLRGYAFERRIKQYYEQQGYFVIRQGKSKFPDLIVWKKPEEPFQFTKVIGVECKCNKYLSKEEKELAKKYLTEGKFAEMWVAYRKNRKMLFYQINR